METQIKEVVKVNPKEYGLDKKKGNEIEQGLSVSISERELLIKEFEEVSILEISKENLPKFKELRLKLVKNRTQGADVWHRTGKEISLRLGQFYDAIKRRENQINQSMESVLMDTEKHFDNLEKERLGKLQADRVVLISKYIEDAEHRDLSSMDFDVWDAYLATKKKDYNDRLVADKKAEEARIAKEKAEKVEQERIKRENEQLKKAAEAREQVAEVERIQRERKEEKERLEREKIESKRIEEERKERKKQDDKLQEEREERERVEVELQAKKDKEIADKKALEDKKRVEELAPDKDKLVLWIDNMIIKTPNLKSKESKKICENIESKFDGFRKWALDEIKNLK